MGQTRPPTEQVLDLIFYAPVGLLLGGPKPLPAAVRRGRESLESQVTMARLVGKFAVQRGTHRVRLRAALLFDQTAPPAPQPPDELRRADLDSVRGDLPTLDGIIRVRYEPLELAIPEYDALAASQVVPRLAGLSAAELEAVRMYETDHRARRTILARLDQLQGR